MKHLPFRPAAAALAAAVCTLSSCGKSDNIQEKKPELAPSSEAGPLPEPGKANRLLKEQSSFLRRHAQDPVDWYPWGEEAFARAKAETKPVLLVIGYASCPWTERMTRESYRDPVMARFMNRHFINVLVDREERPDVNNAYLNFHFLTTRKSGWPLHVWLTPEGLPMSAGIYFPPHSESGNPSWELTISHRAKVWEEFRPTELSTTREKVRAYSDEYLLRINQTPERPAEALPGQENKVYPTKLTAPLDEFTARACFTTVAGLFDPVNGGFTKQPKFLSPFVLEFLLGYAASVRNDQFGSQKEALRMIEVTLRGLGNGAMRDHLAGGFHRYSRDYYWAVPQFEKMLYDQGYLSSTLLRAGLATGRREFLKWAEDALDYTCRDLAHPEGPFYCAEGSFSSTGMESNSPLIDDGSYYVWKLDEITALLSPEQLRAVTPLWKLGESGNVPIDAPDWKAFKGLHTVREVVTPAEAARISGLAEADVIRLAGEARTKLLEARLKRPRPLRDDKVITSWNGTAIAALAEAGWVLGREDFLKRAVTAANFVLTKLRNPATGELIHAYLDGGSPAPGFSEDYALTVSACLSLYESTGDLQWLDAASGLMEKHIELLRDDLTGLFFDGPKQPLVFHRIRSYDESTELSPSSTALLNMLRLHSLRPRPAGQPSYAELADKAFSEVGPVVKSSPTAYIRMLMAWEMKRNPPVQIIVDGTPDDPATKALTDAIRQQSRTGSVLIHLNSPEAREKLTAAAPALKDLPSGKPAIHFCRDWKLLQSATTPEQAVQQMQDLFTVKR